MNYPGQRDRVINTADASRSNWKGCRSDLHIRGGSIVDGCRAVRETSCSSVVGVVILCDLRPLLATGLPGRNWIGDMQSQTREIYIFMPN